MSTLAYPDPVSQSVSNLVTDRHKSWLDEVRLWSRRPCDLTTHSWRGPVQTGNQLRDERDLLRDWCADLARRCVRGDDNAPDVPAILSTPTFKNHSTHRAGHRAARPLSQVGRR